MRGQRNVSCEVIAASCGMIATSEKDSLPWTFLSLRKAFQEKKVLPQVRLAAPGERGVRRGGSRTAFTLAGE